MSSYSASEKALHKFYLSNYFISRSSLEVEQILFGNKIKDLQVEAYVFISGLARSGTTALMRTLFATGEYASLQYSNMPILLSPNLWKKKLKLESRERAHGDGIKIDGNSPEEFDEYFWKAFLKDSYISDALEVHEVPGDILEKYQEYVKLICHSKGKKKYISKNNNNILRLDSLLELPNSRVIVLFRDPLSHAASLLKLHKSFSESQGEDPFELDYFNYLGHHEFGLGHKPFLLREAFMEEAAAYPKDTLDYWVFSWINYYEYLLSHLKESIHLIAFEDLTTKPGEVYGRLENLLEPETGIPVPNRHTPSTYSGLSCSPELKKRATGIYDQLKSKDLLS
ncbi:MULTISPECIES: sulfotransferase [Robiginitalea]|uniref:Sulfotransferase family protein n=1 Tax=Robiginitalea biformata (strain ATCC BAA-864 / DSM 15991 / KCTC 12146 / HTCC2501) TaxID=313596 RepID=A4CKD4_ROBBH|nr:MULTISPECIES: sulfotransferase [Robiginitalea]EAR15333.1 hypothetical protein RB2501_13434 [Robiginitalea biformata HTCC2501]MDC6353831.1 sulfotransferase [Robiginitalea sp. PM2]MDC6374098.1 sulfotransferase [Robiginitalea sp. SP8]